MADEQTIDELNIKINSEAKQSSSGLDKIVASIEKLQKVTSGGVGNLTGIAASLAALSKNLAGMKSQSGTVSSLANSINKLNDARTDHISGGIKTLTDSLKTLGGMDSSLKTIISDLASISRSGGGSTAMSALKLQAQAAKTQATIDKSALTSAKAQEGLKAIAEKNRQIEESAHAAAQQEQELGDSINRAIQQHIAQYGSAGAFPNIAADLGAVMPDYGEEVSWPESAPSKINSDSIKQLKAAMNEVGSAASSTMNEVSNGSSRAAGFVDKLKASVSGVKDKLSNLGSTSNSFFSMGRFYGWYFILRQIVNTFGGWINNINSYIENMNLFDVAMGKSAESGEKLANSLQSVLGIDAGEAMRYMGVFQQMTTSFGVANKQATTMSENLTQLGYDLASFYNISTSTTFEKLESGLSGQSRALRELGIDISSARLQQELYNLGIKEKVNNLSQADKAELRYLAIMKQTANAQGDMARTIQTPANALRVLQAQLAITGRAIGSIFIPALEAILPAVTAVIEVIGDLASELASMLGFKLPKIDYSSLKSISAGADDVADSANNAANGIGNVGEMAKGTNKQLNDLISGFDALNILHKNQDEDDAASKTSGLGGSGNVLSGISLPSYDALKDAIGNNIDSLKEKIKDFLSEFRTDPLKAFSDALWGVNGVFSDLGKIFSHTDFADILNGITASIMGFGLTKNPVLALAIGAVSTAISSFMPEKAKIDLLNGSLIALGGALVLKTFTGIPFKLALGVSALTTSGLIKLIGKDSAINALASSFTGLGVSLMAYTFTGSLPLAIALGSASTAISALAIHYSELRIAPALLAGVSSALLAFKFGGFSQGSAGLVGLSVAITSFAELNSISPGLRSSLLGVAGAIAGIGTAIRLGLGPQGVFISAVAGTIVGLGVALKQASEDAKKADLEKRFGSISLSAQEVEDIAKRLTSTPWTIKIDAAITAKEKVEEFEKNLKSDVKTLNKMNWEVSVGVKLTKSEMSTYKSTIDSFIADAKSYVQQQHYAVTLAIDAILTPGSATYKNLTDFTNKYYDDSQIQLDKLGKQLSDEVNKAFEDNVLSEGEVIKIQEIQKKMNDLLQKIADQKFTATLISLELDTQGMSISAQSFQDLQKKIQSDIDDEMKQVNQNKVTVIEAAQTQLEVDKKAGKADAEKVYQQTIQDIQDSFNRKKATLELSGLNISLNTFKSKFGAELKAAEPVLASGVQGALSYGAQIGVDKSKDVYTTSVSGLIHDVSNTYVDELENMEQSGKISKAAKENIASLVSALQPTDTDLKQIASATAAAGKQVPENIAKGISDIEQLKAISGNADSINYMIGKKFSSDKTFLNTLATVKDAGKQIDSATAQGLVDNLQLVKDKSGSTIIGIKDSVTGKVTDITPTLKQNLSDLGVNMSDSLVQSVNDKKTDISNAGKSSGEALVNGTNEGIENNKSSSNEAVSHWYDGIVKWWNNLWGIHSPSTVMADSAYYVVEGFNRGIDNNKWSTDSPIQDWVNNIKDFFSWDSFQSAAQNAVNGLLYPFQHISWPSIEVPKFHVAYDYNGWGAQAFQWLGLPGTPNIRFYAKGGVFDAKSIIGVGEYAGAQSNPEIVTPQAIMKQTEDESNKAVIAAVNAASEKSENREEKLAKLLQFAIESALNRESGGTINLYNVVDTDMVSKKVYKIQKKQGKRFITQPT